MIDTSRLREDAAASVLAAAREMHAGDLVGGTAGNVSARVGDGTFCLTPSGVDYASMTLADLVFVSSDGSLVSGEQSPSSEKALHLACYERYPEVGGVVHCHPRYASMFAVLGRRVPAVIEEVVVYIGGDVEVCDYHLTGSTELGEAVSEALADRSAVLMANHGLVCVGKNPADALGAAFVVERTAHIVWGAELLGEVRPIPPKVNEDFAGVYRWVRQDMWLPPTAP